MNYPGKFIVFEGIDGSGKTSQLDLLYKRLNKENVPIYKTKEPSNGEIGKFIRSTYLNGKCDINPMVLTGLFAVDRLDHIIKELVPILNNNINILSDRYCLSSLVYQGQLTSLDHVLYHNKISMKMLTPDITIFIDIDPKIAMDRIKNRSIGIEIFESYKQLILFRSMYLEYIEMLKNNGERFLIVDGSMGADELSDIIYENIRSVIV